MLHVVLALVLYASPGVDLSPIANIKTEFLTINECRREAPGIILSLPEGVKVLSAACVDKRHGTTEPVNIPGVTPSEDTGE